MRPAAPLIAFAVLVGGCQDKVRRPACPAEQVCIEYGNNLEPATLDPHKANLVDESTVISDLMEGLTTDAPDGSPAPGAATHWDTSADGLTWTFHLRESRWSDGTPVTADDFVYGLRRVLDPKTASIYAYLVAVVKNGPAVTEGKAPLEAVGARALGPRTLEITLEHPVPYLLELAKHPSFFPAPRHVVERYGDDWVRPGRYVSNGAFKLADWRLGDRITVVRNPNFHAAASVCPDRINYYPTPDAITAERQVARGELDLNTRFQTNRFQRLQKTMPGYPRTGVGLATAYMSLNTRGVPALRDVRVRRALSMGLDREFLTTQLMRAGQAPAYAFVPPPIAGYVPQAERPRLSWAGLPFAERQAQARALLAEAGYGPERPLRLTLTAANNTNTLLLAEATQADWRAIGVELTIQQNEGGIAFAAYRNRDFDVGSMQWIADFNDPVTFLGLMHSATGAQNYGDYKNPAYDALLGAADQEPDAARRARLLARAEQLMLDDEAFIPMYHVVNTNLVSPKLTGWVDSAANFHRARYLCLSGQRRT